MANWKELSGKNNWAGLLVPLKKDLGQTIIHYGERVQAIYDAIDDDINSPTYGLPKYKESEFFAKVGLGMYTMKKYLYATADVMSKVDVYIKSQTAWIGYVAVATDEGKKALGRRDIMICWRGTLTPAEWIKDMDCTQTSASVILGQHPENPCVHKGFLSIYMSARDQVLKAVRELVDQYKHEEISITVSGHCLGSALAAFNAADIVTHGYNKPTGSNTTCMVTDFVFASPKAGNSGFTTVFNKLSDLHLLHIKHVTDPVPELPPFNNFVKLGIELYIYATVSTVPNPLPLVLTLPEILFKYHELDNLLKAVEAQQEKSSSNLVSNLAVEKLDNGNWKLYLRAPQTQTA